MKNDNNKRTQRTPEELILETQAKLERLRVKQAKEVAKSDPEVAALNDTKEAIRKEASKARTILGDGPQSGKARIAKHEAWIAKIKDEMAEADYTLARIEQQIEAIDAEITAKISQLSA